MKMIKYTKEQKQYLDKIDELLSLRESKKASLKDTNRILADGFGMIKSMPIRWYVRNEGQQDFGKVLKYLSKKHKRKQLTIFQGCGCGEVHGEYAFVPDDCQYSFEITQDEFNILVGALAGNGA